MRRCPTFASHRLRFTAPRPGSPPPEKDKSMEPTSDTAVEPTSDTAGAACLGPAASFFDDCNAHHPCRLGRLGRPHRSEPASDLGRRRGKASKPARFAVPAQIAASLRSPREGQLTLQVGCSSSVQAPGHRCQRHGIARICNVHLGDWDAGCHRPARL